MEVTTIKKSNEFQQFLKQPTGEKAIIFIPDSAIKNIENMKFKVSKLETYDI